MEYINKESAMAVLRVAKEGGYLEDLPEDENEIIKLAKFYIEEAEKEFKSNPKMRRDKTIKEILGIKTMAKSEDAWRQFSEDPVEKVTPESSLPLPKIIETEEFDMPSDLTTISDRDVRKLHGVFNAYMNRARWLLANATTDLANATHLRDEIYRQKYIQFNKDLSDSGARVTKDVIDSFVKEEEKYIEYDKSVRENQNTVTKYKALVEIYSSNVERLSREWTMRQNEWERGK